jgi:peptidoglycan/LPS O-acetylase OafA/YrhL
VERTIIFLLLALAVLWLQVYLSRRPSPWPGRILPALSLLTAVLFALMMYIEPDSTPGQIVVQMLSTFLYANIPTVVLMLIYLACRCGMRRQQVDRTRIQDL